MSIAHLTFATRDIQTSAQFLEAVLGWRRLPIPDNCVGQVLWLEIAPGQELHLIRVDDFSPSPYEQEYGRHLAIQFPASALPGIKERLIEQGSSIIAPIRPTPHERFFFREPSGYMIEIINQDEFVKGA